MPKAHLTPGKQARISLTPALNTRELRRLRNQTQQNSTKTHTNHNRENITAKSPSYLRTMYSLHCKMSQKWTVRSTMQVRRASVLPLYPHHWCGASLAGAATMVPLPPALLYPTRALYCSPVPLCEPCCRHTRLFRDLDWVSPAALALRHLHTTRLTCAEGGTPNSRSLRPGDESKPYFRSLRVRKAARRNSRS